MKLPFIKNLSFFCIFFFLIMSGIATPVSGRSVFFQHKYDVLKMFPDTIKPQRMEQREIFKKVEQMPTFPGCEHLDGSHAYKEECTKKALIEYVFNNLQYPEEAKKNKIEGNCVVQFIIMENGTLAEINIIRDIGYGCGEEVARVIRKMNDDNIVWTPGRQLGRPVQVLYTLPVRFKL
jgi:TonB family protein